MSMRTGNLGVTYFFQSDYAKAAPQFRAAVKLRPTCRKFKRCSAFQSGAWSCRVRQSDLEHSFPLLQDDKVRVQAGWN